jgi:hypothetical protein
LSQIDGPKAKIPNLSIEVVELDTFKMLRLVLDWRVVLDILPTTAALFFCIADCTGWVPGKLWLEYSWP